MDCRAKRDDEARDPRLLIGGDVPAEQDGSLNEQNEKAGNGRNLGEHDAPLPSEDEQKKRDDAEHDQHADQRDLVADHQTLIVPVA